MISKALSVRAPWWWFILHGKDIENRSLSFAPRYRGPVWLHAGKWWEPDEVQEDYADGLRMAEAHGLVLPEPDWDQMRAAGGCVVGSVRIDGYTEQDDSPWFLGPLGLKLSCPVPLECPVPLRGYLGLFNVLPGIISDGV